MAVSTPLGVGVLLTSNSTISTPPAINTVHAPMTGATKSKVGLCAEKSKVFCGSTSSLSTTTLPTTTTCTPIITALLEHNAATSTTATTTAGKFSYSRASSFVRWPHLKPSDPRYSPITLSPVVGSEDAEFPLDLDHISHKNRGRGGDESPSSLASLDDENPPQVFAGVPSRTKAKKMTKLALKRAKDWRQRVQFLTDKILHLNSGEFVADVLDAKMVQMTPTDFCFVVKWVGQSSWQRALEVYEWLNLRHWYSPNARMLATILSVLGKASQEALAVEIFNRAEPSVGNTVQVYNAMMGVYARNGQFPEVQQLLNLMRERGCVPDLVSFNTLINARLKSGPLVPNLAIDLLNEVRRSGLRPDIITYNTLISACSREPNLEDAVKLYHDMEVHRCQPDLWTYNAMISVFGRCQLSAETERLFAELGSKGFLPDAVTYNSMLYAFAREGNVDKVKTICEEMVKRGFAKDEMTYNTIIHMYGKLGQYDLALQLYEEMKCSGRSPDAVTCTVLIDSLGKASKITEAANVMSEMMNAGVKPTLKTYSALICGYAKVGKRTEAEKTFDCMLRSGIKPDLLAYSVMLDIHLRSNETRKAMTLYRKMIRDGFTPDLSLYEVILQVLNKENEEEFINTVVKDMENSCDFNLQLISSVLVKGKCYSHAAKMLRLEIMQGHDLDYENLLAILSAYSSSGRFSEAQELVNHIREHVPASYQWASEALVVILCEAHESLAALNEYNKCKTFNMSCGGLAMYEGLIKCCQERELFAEASQVFSDMRFIGIEPSQDIYQNMAIAYCRMGFPEMAHHLVDQAEVTGIPVEDYSVYVNLIESYGKLKLLEKAESIVGSLRQKCGAVDRKVWNSLIQAYAANGYYEKARASFNTMMRDGPYPTVNSVNGLMQALIVDGRLNELYVVVEELQDMGFKISKSTILLMLDAFAQAGNIFEVLKIYHGMKAAGYYPTMHLYRVMIGLLSRGKRVRDVEAMVSEMKEAGFSPDLSIWNSMLKLYTEIEDFKKTVQVYQQIQEAGLKPDEETYNTLILMYCRDRRPEEGLLLMHEMKRLDLKPKLDTYKSLITAFGKLELLSYAEEIFEGLLLDGHKLNRSFCHTMMKIYRSSGNYSKAEKLLSVMKESGVEPTIATMHLLMTSYGSSGHPIGAEEVLNNLKSNGLNISILSYTSVIDAYLKNGNYNIGIQKLKEMKREGLEPDHRIWTCFIRAASLSRSRSEATVLLNAVRDAGFDLPIRILQGNSKSLMLEIDQYFEKLEPIEDNAAFNFVNALEDLLWAFELRATASWVFQLAIKRNIYHCHVFRVADKDWGADFRKLSAGAALVGLTLWLDQMQDASLNGYPESPKSVVLITGTSLYNNISLNSTLKAYLWEMGSPFLPCKTRSGLLVAKGHSLRMWLKDSPYCLDLELKNSLALPETNSMQVIEGCFIRCGLVSAFKDITERLGQVTPKKFARLALLPDAKRDKAICIDIEGKKEKLAKLEKTRIMRSGNVTRLRNKKIIRRAMLQSEK